MKLSALLLVGMALIAIDFSSFAQNVGIGTTSPDASAKVDIQSTNSGILIPRLTSAQRSGISPAAAGLLVYDSDTDSFWYYDGTQWIELDAGGNNTLDEAYDEGGTGAGRTITADGGAIEITGTSGAIGLTTDGNIRLETDDTWIGAGSTIERIVFDNSLDRIDVEAADVTMDDGKWIGIDGSSPRIIFDGGANDQLTIRNADIELQDDSWLGLGSTIERIEFQAADNEISLMGAEVGIGTLAPTNELDVSGQIRMRTGAMNGYIPVGDANGVMTWTDPASLVSGNTLDEAYDEGGAGVGRIIIADNGAINIGGTDGLDVTGTFNSGAAITSGSGPRMYFNPRMAAFRAGYVNGNQWDNGNVGLYSIALGHNTEATGQYSLSLGSNGTASGSSSVSIGHTTASNISSVAIGNLATASGQYAIAIGNGPTASGQHSLALGSGGNDASGRYSVSIGNGITSPSAWEFVAGRYNTTYTPNGTTTWDASDRLFVIGNGSGSLSRSNALVVLKNGDVGIGTSTPAFKLDSRGYTASSNQLAVIPLWPGGSETFGNTSGQVIGNYNAGFEPALIDENGDVDVKLVVRISSTTAPNNNFQLETENVSNGIAYPIDNTSWTYTDITGGGTIYIATSPWRTWNAGTNPQDVRLFGWVSSGSTTITNAYLIVRPHQP